MGAELVSVELFFIDEKQQEAAESLLRHLHAKNICLIDGVVEAEISRDDVDIVLNGDLPFDFPNGLPEVGAELLTADERANPFADHELSEDDRVIVEEYKEKAESVELDTRQFGGVKMMRRVAGAASGIAHAVRKFTPANLGGGAGEVMRPAGRANSPLFKKKQCYQVLLAGPIREDWNRQLRAAGVRQIEHFEFRDLFTAFMSEALSEKVLNLPFVRAIRVYDLAATLTTPMRRALKQRGDFAAVSEPLVEEASKKAVEKSEEEFSADDSAPQIDTETHAHFHQNYDNDLRDPLTMFDIAVHRAEDMKHIVRIINMSGDLMIADRARTLIRVKGSIDSLTLAALADLPEIRSIAPYRPPTLFCPFAKELIGISVLRASVGGSAKKWSGEGEKVCIIDSGVDSSHPDLTDRIAAPLSYGEGLADDKYGHGTHVAGIIACTGSASGGDVTGVAPGAKIVSIGVVPENAAPDLPIDLGDLLQLAVDNGAEIINMSLGWARNMAGEYNIQGESVDRFLYEHPEILVIAAAGNEGEAPEGHHLMNKIGQPASAKNVITVGASTSSRDDDNVAWGMEHPSKFPLPPASTERISGKAGLVAAISSRGPTDARVTKPDIVAPGTRILSTRAKHAKKIFNPDFNGHDGKYGFLSGTSMAAPVVAGAAAVLRQYLREELDSNESSSALIKALLIASAKRLPAAPGSNWVEKTGYPDFEQGFGQLNLGALFREADGELQRQFDFIDIATNSPEALSARQPFGASRKSKRRYKFRISTPPSQPLRVALVWTDPPGRALQNNLNLALSAPSGKMHVGNEEQKAFRDWWVASGNARSPDKDNNVEIISIDAPEEGNYVISVHAHSNTKPPQGFALCVVGDFDQPLEVF